MKPKKQKKAEFTKWMGPILEALRDLNGSAKPRDIVDWIGKNHNIPDKILYEKYQGSGKLKFPNQVAWARQYLIWEKLLISSKHGVWTLTNKGWKTRLTADQSHSIFLRWVKIFQELRERKTSLSDDSVDNIIEAQEKIQPDEEQVNIKPTLLNILQNLSPEGFERICARLLNEYGFENIEITQRSHDGGIDGFGTLKINPFIEMGVFFQCKRFRGTVPVDKVQALIGATESNERRVEKCILITTGTFTKRALQIEKSNTKLELIDGEKLVKLFEKIELGVEVKTVYDPDINFFDEYR
jgi:restriction system protein